MFRFHYCHACPGAMGIFMNSDMDPDFVRSGFRIGGDQNQFFNFVTTVPNTGTLHIQSAVQVLLRCEFFACLIGCYRCINISFACGSAILNRGSGSRRPINNRSSRIRILPGHFLCPLKKICCRISSKQLKMIK